MQEIGWGELEGVGGGARRVGSWVSVSRWPVVGWVLWFLTPLLMGRGCHHVSSVTQCPLLGGRI